MKTLLEEKSLHQQIFFIGARVRSHPATDLFMRGARYGNILSLRRNHALVQFDVIRRAERVRYGNVTLVE